MLLDSSYKKAKDILLSHIHKFIPDIRKTISENTDFKTNLQELLQKESGATPEYRTVKKEGPIHNVVFTICVKINGEIFGYGTGRSKKIAEQDGAKKALIKFLEKNK